MAYKSIKDKIKSKAKSRAKRKTRSYAKKKLRRANLLTVFICIFALILGVLSGVFAYKYICRDDRFELRGQKEVKVLLNSPEFFYYDDGVEIIEFGKDVSDDVEIETNMTCVGSDKYTVDTTVPGRYYIKYTVDSPKYGEVCRIRTVVVGGEG